MDKTAKDTDKIIISVPLLLLLSVKGFVALAASDVDPWHTKQWDRRLWNCCLFPLPVFACRQLCTWTAPLHLQTRWLSAKRLKTTWNEHWVKCRGFYYEFVFRMKKKCDHTAHKISIGDDLTLRKFKWIKGPKSQRKITGLTEQSSVQTGPN